MATKAPDVAKWLAAEAYTDDEHHHHHDLNRHDDRIRAWCVTSPEPISINSFNLFMELLQSYHGPNLLRVKGIVKLAEQPDRPVVIHGVQHVFHPPVELEAWPHGASPDTRLVFITRDIERQEIEGLLKAFTNKISLDAAAFQHDDTLATGPKGGLFD